MGIEEELVVVGARGGSGDWGAAFGLCPAFWMQADLDLFETFSSYLGWSPACPGKGGHGAGISFGLVCFGRLEMR